MFPNFHRPILAAVLCLSLSACATLERHPVLTAIGTAIIVGSIAAIAEHHHDQRSASRVDLCNAVGPDGRGTCVIGACAGL
jgi:hypothetical protein